MPAELAARAEPHPPRLVYRDALTEIQDVREWGRSCEADKAAARHELGGGIRE